LGSAHHYAIWDDHDYGPNDGDWTYVHKGDALDAFRAYWANPSYGLPDTPGVFGQFTWADVDFFLVDVRTYRAPSGAPRTPSKTMLGERQFKWLIDGLTSSKAPFKIVVGGGQFLSPFDHFEGYAQFPHEQQRLVDALVERGVEGVVFLSGDRHHTELVRIQPDGFYPLYDFTSSPLASRGAQASKERESKVRVPGTLVYGRRSFGLLRLEGPAGARVMTLEARDTKGALLWTHRLEAKALRVPNKP
jgi:alkaline phosphatase D